MMYVIKVHNRITGEYFEKNITAENVIKAINIMAEQIDISEDMAVKAETVYGKMTVREFIRGDGDIDIVDDVCEDLWIAVCRPVLLTEEGEREFSEVLNYEVEIRKHNIAVLLINQYKDWEHKLKKAEKFFCAHAGYCSDEDWDKWFYLQD